MIVKISGIYSKDCLWFLFLSFLVQPRILNLLFTVTTYILGPAPDRDSCKKLLGPDRHLKIMLLPDMCPSLQISYLVI